MTVNAYYGPLPENTKGIEFKTCAIITDPHNTSMARWTYLNDETSNALGIYQVVIPQMNWQSEKIQNNEYGMIRIKVIKNTQIFALHLH